MPRKSAKKSPKLTRPRSGMYRFLVMGRSKADDVPLRSFRTAQEAYDYALAIPDEHLHKEIERVYGFDSAGFYFVTLVEFRGGVPQGTKIVRSFE